MIWILLFLAVLLGVALPVQVGVNAQLRVGVGHPMVAATLSFAVGTLGLLAVTALLRPGLPAAGAALRMPWWTWTGGLLGALYIASTIILAPKLGAAALLAAIVAGQMLASLVLDHFGLLGFPVLPISPMRVAAVLLIIIGVLMLQVPKA